LTSTISSAEWTKPSGISPTPVGKVLKAGVGHVDVGHCHIRPYQAKRPGSHFDRGALEKAAEHLGVPADELVAPEMNGSKHVGEGAVVAIARAERLGVAALPGLA
jgi:hypothetical protein